LERHVADSVSRRAKNFPRSTDTTGAPEADERLPGSLPVAVKTPARQPPWEKEALPAESGSFGEWLRRQREMREIGLREIAEHTKISFRYLEAMETDRFDLLPAPIFAKGFLRAYAKYVGLSPDEVVNHYLAVHSPKEAAPGDGTQSRTKPRAVDPGASTLRRSWSYGSLLALAGLVLLILVAAAAYFADHRHEEPPASAQTPSIAAPPVAPPPVQAAPPLPTPSSPLEVSLDFSQDCWIEVLIDGKKRISELRVQGEALQLDAEKSLSLTLGNAGAVAIHVNGLPLDLDRKQGDVLRDLVITLDTLKALREKRGTAQP
jgi:cytoskeleton protein RodZ